MLNQAQNIKNLLSQCCYTEFERNEVADMLIDSLEWEINFFHNWNIVSPRPANWKEQAAQFAEMIKFIDQNKAKVKAIGKVWFDAEKKADDAETNYYRNEESRVFGWAAYCDASEY